MNDILSQNKVDQLTMSVLSYKNIKDMNVKINEINDYARLPLPA